RRPLDLNSIFGERDVWLEIGFGGGEHLVHQAKANPKIGFIGCEPYLNGVAMLLSKIQSDGLDNIRVYPGDARHLFDVLPPQSISRAFLLYPDPWPKKRHHRRRFVTQEYLAPLAKVMKKDAIFRVATDIEDYIRQALKEILKSGFETQTDLSQDQQTAWPDWISTRYEQKAVREGRKPHYLTFKR
ncbi:MAG: tRNA (guanosine(46)-N7)-methyltransferase TrmB, partial [Aestuariivita sp.]|nr:tRNA (guanosine(46)-N7)-methyltransferase TrmB [Aestuariivita sp.]